MPPHYPKMTGPSQRYKYNRQRIARYICRLEDAVNKKHMPKYLTDIRTDLKQWNACQYEKITTPLQDEQIRLVTLHHGSSPEDIQCSFETRTLSDRQQYHALSYRWGALDDQKSIFVNSRRFYTSQNLHNALSYLRSPDEDLTIWVDFLCINQNDKAEKQRQVDSMHRIYGQAEAITAWLGEHKSNSEILFALQKFIVGESNHLWDIDLGRSLESFLSRDYWSRAWIVQEILARPDRLRLRCASDEMLLADFRHVILPCMSQINAKIGPGWKRRKREPVAFSHPYDTPMKINMLVSRSASGQVDGISLSEFLDCFLDCQCSDPRDNIFAFKHLFIPDLQRRIAVNYSLPPEEVIMQAFIEMIEETKSLHILVIRSRQKPPKKLNDWQKRLPTWCPFVGVPYKNMISSEDTTTTANHNAPIFFTNGGRVLYAKGVIVGRLCEGQHSSSFGSPKKFGNSRDLHCAEEKLNTYYQFIARMYSKRRNSRMPSICKTILASQCRDSLSTSCTASAGYSTDCINFYQKFAQITFARAIYEFRWKRSLPSQGINVAQNDAVWDCAYVPNNAQRGDVICAICGCEKAVLLRRNGQHYLVLGEVTIFGFNTSHVLSQCNTLEDLTLC